MKSYDILMAFETIDDTYVIDAKEKNMNHTMTAPRKTGRSVKRTALLIAAIVAALALCGFAAYELGLFDPWFQKPSADPTAAVQSAIEGQLEKEYTITVRVDEVIIDNDETARMVEMYQGSELAKSRGWTDEYLAEHFLAVRAKYYVEYDHTKTFLDDGNMDQYFYLVEDVESGLWTVVENSTPGQPGSNPD